MDGRLHAKSMGETNKKVLFCIHEIMVRYTQGLNLIRNT